MVVSDLKKLAAGGIAVVALSTVVLTGIAIITGYKQTLLVDNDTADDFIASLAIFGTFLSVVILGFMGKILVNLFKSD